jgi:thiol-disulfide isomerase/thioredoxin
LDYEKLKQGKFSFIYLTTKNCNICRILQPKLRRLAENYKESSFNLIELDNHKDAAGFFMVFTVPTFLVYSEGKELIRESRHMNIEDIKNKLDRYYEMLF